MHNLVGGSPRRHYHLLRTELGNYECASFVVMITFIFVTEFDRKELGETWLDSVCGKIRPRVKSEV